MVSESDEFTLKLRQRMCQLQDEIHRQDLATFSHEANWHLIDELLTIAFQYREERTTSGLVELQRRLHRRMQPTTSEETPSASSLPPEV